MFGPERKFSPVLSEDVVAELVLRSGAFQEGDFTFSSGIKSPIKIEADVLRSSDNFQVHRDISECMFLVVTAFGIEPDVVVGVIRGGVSFARDLSGFLDKPFASRLGFKRDAVRQAEVKGFVPEGSNVLVVEDVVTFGTSSIPCVLNLRHHDKANVLGVISVFNYGFLKSAENFQKHNIPNWSLLYFQDFMQELRKSGKRVEHLEKWHASAPDEYERLKNAQPLHV